MQDKNNIHVLSRGALIDDGQLLLCKTLDLNPGFYFLPGGHVEHGESVEETVLREMNEESGQACEIQELLGCLEYSFEPGHNSICHNHEYNFFFKIRSTALCAGQPIPQMEKHIGLLWVPLSDIHNLDLRPAPLKKFLPQWLGEEKLMSFHSEMI